jgi:hypothetical protein
VGAELTCDAVVNGRKVRGKAKLETSTLEFRGPDVKLVLPFASLKKVQTENGELYAASSSDRLTLSVGAAAAKWADKILHPPSRLQKLGVKPEWRVVVAGSADDKFVRELTTSVASVSRRKIKGADAAFLFVERAADLHRIAAVKAHLAEDGALWTVRPKGHAEITERGVMQAAKAAGLVDVKVVAFSRTHTAEKFVIPKRDRRKS